MGLTEDVKKFLHYNANKALMNLGYEALFPPEACRGQPRHPLGPLARTPTRTTTSSRARGSSYVIGKAEATEDEDWDF